MKNILTLIFLAFCPLAIMADAVDDLEKVLREKPQIHEKIYVHTDNSMYFIGDTLWYKAYVVRADNLQPTNLSKLLYVELLTPDGYLVERQHVVVNKEGCTWGQFVLEDSLYSGYYEIRAYTRWQLNFNVTERDYTRDDRLKFYGDEACKDFFRDFEGLYSRVVPVYQKPKEEGNYIDRYMAKRPKQRILKEHQRLHVSFYPEGGQMVVGLPSTIAFEVSDHNAQHLDIEGRLPDGTVIRPQHFGKGSFTITPASSNGSAKFEWNGKTFSFALPKASETGMVLSYSAEKHAFTINSKGVTPAAYALLCRGKLQEFKRIEPGQKQLSIDNSALPTGINEIIVYDNNAQPLASRLFFIDNKDYGQHLDVTLSMADGQPVAKNTTVAPYAKLSVSAAMPAQNGAGKALPLSIAVRDAQTDERGYDNGNIMTDMLLSSELKGFIEYPKYYFESDDATHRDNLDLLMMVQGWRRYKRVEKLRYLPERGLTYEGTVMKIPSTARVMELEDLEGVGKAAPNLFDVMEMDMEAATGNAEDGTSGYSDNDDTGAGTEINTISDISQSSSEEPEVEWADTDDMKLGGGKVRKAVYVEAELDKDGQVAGAITHTNANGRFLINLPPYYDQAVLFAKAYNKKDSVNKCMQAAKRDKGRLNERDIPDYFVKKDMIYPVFTHPYSWYQINSPDLFFVDEDDDLIPENSTLAGNHTLQTVVVKAKRRGKRGIDMTKPAIVRDAYKVYNELTDYGLSYGVLNFNKMPMAVATYFFGNMGRRNQFNIRAMVDETTFYRNYVPTVNEYDKPAVQTEIFNKLRLNRLKNVRIYTDYELRTDSGEVVESHSPDVTIVFETIENDAKRYTYRDRRYIFDGITYPEAFYSPDYSKAIPEEPKDYRRTLYWNPNVKLDENGSFQAEFYNNSRETRVSVSAAGVDSSGQMYYK